MTYTVRKMLWFSSFSLVHILDYIFYFNSVANYIFLPAEYKWNLVLCAELVMLLEWWSGTDCTLYTDQATVDMFGKEHAIIILNHNFEIDFLCGWTMCERYGILGVSIVT